jgi:hypothetical protein
MPSRGSEREAAIWLFTVSIYLAVASSAHARECKPRHVPQAEFGSMNLGGRTLCPSLKKGAEQSCTVSKDGVEYGVSEGLIVNKTITPKSYFGKLPFNLAWREKLENATQKINRITKGKLSLFSGNDSNGHYLVTDNCLANKNGSYGLEMYFDKSGGLAGITGRILYP